MARWIEPLGWHLQVYMRPDQIVESAAMLKRIPVPLVFDHMGQLGPFGTAHPAYGVLRSLLDGGRSWVKLSGAYLNLTAGPVGTWTKPRSSTCYWSGHQTSVCGTASSSRILTRCTGSPGYEARCISLAARPLLRRVRMRVWLLAVSVVCLVVPMAAQSPKGAAPQAPGRVVAAQPGDPLPRVRPEAVCLSSQRLAEIGKVLNADIAANRLPGAVLAIARHGKLVYFEAFGYRDKATNASMTTDAIFNIASMTKPLTTVAALGLLEQGKLSIDDPLAKYLPQFARMQVAVLNPAGDAIVDRVPATRQITLQDLMRHTSGLIYGNRGNTAVHKLYPSGSAALATGMTPTQFANTLGSLPLLHQPGAVWDYGFGLDLTGVVVETIEKRSLGEVMQARIFGPLGMTSTGFMIPASHASRYATVLPIDPATGQPQSMDRDLTKPLTMECGGGCAHSTAGDYMRFVQMLLNKGVYKDTRVLGRKTVEYMLSNQLGPEVRNLIANADPTRADYGFGLGVAVRTTPGIARTLGSVGDFSWPGSSGTNWWADPKEDLAVVFMAHTPGAMRWRYRQVINQLVEQAIVD